MSFGEIGFYEVRDGKIVSEQFFYQKFVRTVIYVIRVIYVKIISKPATTE